MKIPVGIVGYGNLGKAVEKNILKSDFFELVAIFSRRDLNNTINYSKINNYKNKIKLLFLCGGSQNELEKQSFELIKNFNIAESYDNHARLKSYHKALDKMAKENKKIAICSLGWDPGLFSFMRGLFDSLDVPPYTFWGKGLSQGHTQAIKNIPGVKDAVQFTIPNEEFIEKIKNGEKLISSKDFHKRECFVVANENHNEIKNAIVNMKDYFLGYETIINFVSQDQLDKIKSFAHKGQVIGLNNEMNFSLNLPSNPDFTSKVLINFAKNFKQLKKEKKYGVHTMFDLPLKNILHDDVYKYL